MDKRLKELFNAELSAIGQPNNDAGDEWTEMIERVDEVRVHEARLAALREAITVIRDVDRLTPDDEVVDETVRRYEELIKREEEGR